MAVSQGVETIDAELLRECVNQGGRSESLKGDFTGPGEYPGEDDLLGENPRRASHRIGKLP
jgi:hypothetical protein